MEKVKSRYVWADVVRFSAIFLVVFIHNSTTPSYVFSNFILLIPYTIAPSCVPLFVLLSGALLLNKNEDAVTFYKKRLHKLLIPWVCWTIIYMLFAILFNNHKVTSFLNLIRFFHVAFLTNLWFLPMIFTLYLLTPLTWLIIREKYGKIILLALIIIWYLFINIASSVNSFFQLGFSLHFPIFIQFIGYFLLGYFLIQLKATKKRFYIYLVLFLLCLTAIISGSIYSAYRITDTSSISSFYFGQVSPLIAILSCSLFLFLVNLFTLWQLKNKKVKKIITELSLASFGIYLVHGLLIDILLKIFPIINAQITALNPLLSTMIKTLIIFSLSFITIYLLRKYKITRYLAP